MVMRVCEYYTALAHPHGIGWVEHLRGVEHLLVARGSGSLQSDLALELFANARHAALCHSLIARKAMYFAQPCWRAVASRLPVKDQSTFFHDIAVGVPGLLGRYDELPTRVLVDFSELESIVAEAEEIEHEMRTWMSDWIDCTDGPQYETMPVSTFTTFAARCTDRSIDTAYNFPNFMIAHLHAMYWLCMYFLRTTILGVFAARTEASCGESARAEQQVPEEERLIYIMDLCRCIPFFCEPASSATGVIGIFLPLRTAALYFLDRGMIAEAKWIGNVSATVFDKGLAPPSIDQRKLRDLRNINLE